MLKFSSIKYFCYVFLFIISNCTNENTSNELVPEGMVFIPSGISDIGSETGLPNEQPVFQVHVKPFYMDKNLVTVKEFRLFVEATEYVTEAENIGNGVVFDFKRAEWTLVDDATWEYPNGLNSEPADDNHPVRQISWNDAKEYLKWRGKRLPTEIEWEHAAKNGENSNNIYAWGDSLIISDQYQANTWNGTFPKENIPDDGYLQTSPVGEFNITQLGLTDMGGNVWEWTEDWYRPYSDRDKQYKTTTMSEKVLRGGSFMCHISYCHGYRVSARSHTTPDNALFHVGFRGVKDL